MKPSAYNIFIDHPETGETILYNTLYGSTTVCSKEEASTIREILADPSSLGSQREELVPIMEQQKYLVPVSSDEMELIRKRKGAGVEDSNRLDVILMPTQECNFACSYCYENNHPSPMSDQTEADLKAWLAAEMPKHKVTLLLWFGGEPLIAFPRVLALTAHAAEVAERSGTALIRHMTTNGYLLDTGRIRQLLAAGITDYQITLDGPPEVHDKFRALKNGGATFQRIYANIIELAHASPQVKISLRVNFNHKNLHDIPALLEMFPPDIRGRLRVVYEPIFGNCSLSATDNLPRDEISATLADYYALAREEGYDVVHGMSGDYPGKLVYCYAERQSQYVINYNGDVFKCSVTDFSPANRVGHIGRGGIFTRHDERWDRWTGEPQFDEFCTSCIYLPLCMGGCRKVRLTGKAGGTSCSLVPTNASYLLKKLAFSGDRGLIDTSREDRFMSMEERR
jgi:uncharacterized protein